MRLTKELIEKIENETSCGVNEYDDEYYVWVSNDCDEDFELTINKGDDEVEEIINQCDCFDSEEHFRAWFGANNGEPSNARVLLDNCEQIGKHLEQLADLLREAKKNDY